MYGIIEIVLEMISNNEFLALLIHDTEFTYDTEIIRLPLHYFLLLQENYFKKVSDL